jgi:hypothetical protein
MIGNPRRTWRLTCAPCPSAGRGYTAARSISQRRVPHVSEGAGNPMTTAHRGVVKGRIRALPLGSADLSSASPSANPVGRNERASHHDAARNAGPPRCEDDACRDRSTRRLRRARGSRDGRSRAFPAGPQARRERARWTSPLARLLASAAGGGRLVPQGLRARRQRCDLDVRLPRARPPSDPGRRRPRRGRLLRLHRRASRSASSARPATRAPATCTSSCGRPRAGIRAASRSTRCRRSSAGTASASVRGVACRHVPARDPRLDRVGDRGRRVARLAAAPRGPPPARRLSPAQRAREGPLRRR